MPACSTASPSETAEVETVSAPTSAADTNENKGQRRISPDPWVVLFTCLLAAALIVILPRPLSSDVSGQLWIADQIDRGARLYVDLSEINPPLWFWMAMPINWLAGLMQLQPEGVLIACVAGAALLSLAATDRLLGDMPVFPRRCFLLYATLILLIMPARDIGQREMFALMAALPYAALAAARQKGMRVSWVLALLVGAGSALGFALKHYFLGVPVLLEFWLVASMRREWRPFRAETVALAGVGLAYGAAILIVTPGYLTTMVPQLRLAYGAVAPSLLQMILPAQLIWLFTLRGILPQYRALRTNAAPLTIALCIAALGFCAAWMIQHKGWPYQSIPTTGLLALSFAAMLIEIWDKVGLTVRKLAPGILLLPVGLAFIPTHVPITPDADIAPALAGLQPGASVGIVSTEGFTAWPSTIGRGFRFPSRYGQYWMLAAIDANTAGAKDPRVEEFGRQVVRQTVIDYRCLPPERIVFVRADASGNATAAAADPLKFFLRDPEFANLMRHYTSWKHQGIFDAYRLTTPIGRLPGSSCRRGV